MLGKKQLPELAEDTRKTEKIPEKDTSPPIELNEFKETVFFHYKRFLLSIPTSFSIRESISENNSTRTTGRKWGTKCKCTGIYTKQRDG